MTYLNDQEICEHHSRCDTHEEALRALRGAIRAQKSNGRWGKVPAPGIFQCPTTLGKGFAKMHWHVGKRSREAEEKLDAYRVR